METVLTINLSGHLLQIETPAHDALRAYLVRLSQQFAGEPGGAEIVNDIEARVAELLVDRQRVQGLVTAAHVQEVVAMMGEPEDLGATPPATTSATPASGPVEAPRRLLRDTRNKWLGGVCSGLAHHFNLDPSVVRIVFALVTLGGFGFGIILYPLLWAILPAGELPEMGGKRLFRNSDDKLVAGVASGLGAYFGKDPTLIRLLFVAPVVLNATIGFLTFDVFRGAVFPGSTMGLFILAYVVLWMVLPKAVSAYQKKQMRGEVIDVNTIVRFAHEDRAGDSPRAAYVTGYKSAQAGVPARGMALLAKALLLVCVGFFVVTFVVMVVGLFAAIFVSAPLHDYAWSSVAQRVLAWATFGLFFLVPVVALVVWLMRRAMRVRQSSRALRWLFVGGWIAGWVCVALFAASIMRDVQRRATSESVLRPAAAIDGLRVRTSRVLTDCTEFSIDDDDREHDCSGLRVDDAGLAIGDVEAYLVPGTSPEFQIKIQKRSRGRTSAAARATAEGILYQATLVGDTLDLDGLYQVPKHVAFRGQRVDVVIEVPIGKRVLIETQAYDAIDWELAIERPARGRRHARSRKSHQLDFTDAVAPDVWYVVNNAGELTELVPALVEAVTPPNVP